MRHIELGLDCLHIDISLFTLLRFFSCFIILIEYVVAVCFVGVLQGLL